MYPMNMTQTIHETGLGFSPHNNDGTVNGRQFDVRPGGPRGVCVAEWPRAVALVGDMDQTQARDPTRRDPVRSSQSKI